MTNAANKPIFYLKQHCPFCMKLWLYLLETNTIGDVDIREFAAGSEQEQEVRAELTPHLEKITFPAAQIAPGHFVADSDRILAFLAGRTGRDPASLPVLNNYLAGPFTMMMNLWKENHELKAAAAQS